MDTLSTKIHNQTAYISACLEAIGTGWLSPPEDYTIVLSNNPNQSKARGIDRHGKKVHGNLEHVPYVQGPDNLKPYVHPSNYKQSDIEWALTHGMEDLAVQAQEHNPSLIIPNLAVVLKRVEKIRSRPKELKRTR